MADIFDTAQAFQARLNSDAESRARGKSAPETHPDFDGYHCVDCGEGVHPVRLAMGKVRCFECQDFLERGSGR